MNNNETAAARRSGDAVQCPDCGLRTAKNGMTNHIGSKTCEVRQVGKALEDQGFRKVSQGLRYADVVVAHFGSDRLSLLENAGVLRRAATEYRGGDEPGDELWLAVWLHDVLKKMVKLSSHYSLYVQEFDDIQANLLSADKVLSDGEILKIELRYENMVKH